METCAAEVLCSTGKEERDQEGVEVCHSLKEREGGVSIKGMWYDFQPLSRSGIAEMEDIQLEKDF